MIPARTASELCGMEEQLKLSYSLSENAQDAQVSVLTGRTTSHRATISTSKTYNLQRDWVLKPKIFTELKNAQSIVLAQHTRLAILVVHLKALLLRIRRALPHRQPQSCHQTRCR
jgi:hypothetical protein